MRLSSPTDPGKNPFVLMLQWKEKQDEVSTGKAKLETRSPDMILKHIELARIIPSVKLHSNHIGDASVAEVLSPTSNCPSFVLVSMDDKGESISSMNHTGLQGEDIAQMSPRRYHNEKELSLT